MKDEAKKPAGTGIGALYRKMSSWYILFSVAVFLVILYVGYRLARPLLPFLFDSGR
jgi:hypothetical protein